MKYERAGHEDINIFLHKIECAVQKVKTARVTQRGRLNFFKEEYPHFKVTNDNVFMEIYKL